MGRRNVPSGETHRASVTTLFYGRGASREEERQRRRAGSASQKPTLSIERSSAEPDRRTAAMETFRAELARSNATPIPREDPENVRAEIRRLRAEIERVRAHNRAVEQRGRLQAQLDRELANQREGSDSETLKTAIWTAYRVTESRRDMITSASLLEYLRGKGIHYGKGAPHRIVEAAGARAWNNVTPADGPANAPKQRGWLCLARKEIVVAAQDGDGVVVGEE